MKIRPVMTAFAWLSAFIPAMAHAMTFNELLNRSLPKPTYHLTYGAEPGQYGELWLPEMKELHPVVAIIHGGCWLANLPGVELMNQISDDLRSSGIAVWNIEYRRLGTKGAGYPGTFLDIAHATDYLRSIAGTYKLDLAHVAVMGHSAGGQLALWAAARHRLNSKSPLYSKTPLPFRAVVTLAGINDLADYHDHGPSACGGPQTIDRLTGAQDRVNPYADTSPASLLPIGVPQMIISGGEDQIVPERFGNAYAEKAKASGDPAMAIDITGSDHFDLIDPTSAAWIKVKSALLSVLKP